MIKDESELKDFLDKVAGKPIRWSSWDDYSYFIPDGSYTHIGEHSLYGNFHMYGVVYPKAITRTYNVMNGLEGCFIEGGFKWEIDYKRLQKAELDKEAEDLLK